MEELQTYAGLLSGSDLGAPIDTTTGTAQWTGKIALGWQGLNATEATVFENNDDFTLTITFGDMETVLSATATLTATSGGDTGTFTIVEANVANGEELFTGTTRFTVGLKAVEANLRGIIGQQGALAVFATDGAGDEDRGFGSYAGGFVASSGCENDAFDATLDCNEAQKDIYCSLDANAWHLTNCFPRRAPSVLLARDRVVTTCTPIPPATEPNVPDGINCGTAAGTGAPSIASCIVNPYRTNCDNRAFTTLRTTFANTCDADSARPRTADECTKMVFDKGKTVAQCVDDPYQLGCRNPGFNDVRSARDLFCVIQNNYFDTLCDEFGTITELRKGFCGEGADKNPFDADCTSDYISQRARNDRIAFCLIDGNELNIERSCMEAIDARTSICGNDPFDSICGTDYAVERGVACLEDTTDAKRMANPTCGNKGTSDVVPSGDILAYCLSVDLENSTPQLAVENCGSGSVASCLETPFSTGDVCEEGRFANARRLACIENPDANSDCDDYIIAYCNDTTPKRVLNAFHNDCDGRGNSDSIRQQACLANLEANYSRADLTANYKCSATVTLACAGGLSGANPITANPFNKLCFADDNPYQTARETLAAIDMCGHETDTPTGLGCENLTSFICVGRGEFANPFAKICEGVGNLAELKRINCLVTERDREGSCDTIVGASDVVDGIIWEYKAVTVDEDDTPDITSDDTYTTLIIPTEPSRKTTPPRTFCGAGQRKRNYSRVC